MQRYFVNANGSVDHSSFIMDGENAHHMVRVMRMNVNDRFYCVFLNGQSVLAKIDEISSETVTASIVEWIDESKELPVNVTIVSGLPKGDKLEYIIQKGTELGAVRFIPFKADRSIVKWDPKKSAKKRERWGKIAKEAAEQSHRTIIPTVDEPIHMQKLLKLSEEYDHKIVAYEESAKEGEQALFATILSKVKPDESILIIFGPEGGLSSKEVEAFLQHNFLACGLGPRILRTETAPLYALSSISFKFELMR
ncbi:16S rRNA (uracil(1498)-N(3))-methyltransferase [Bacillus sp. 2205SS5-2]|uniref:16S rRNA (uracil(1498)-N(3))-methyltransferase n=1 Tax=Bacillus sp. 2205SS5-2 TaxID=3109031 RepID=UPI0030057F8B